MGSFTSHRILNNEELRDRAYGLSSLSEKTRESNHLQIYVITKVALSTQLFKYPECWSGQGPVSRNSRELFGPEKLAVKLQSACFEKLIFLHVFNIRKTKRIAQFEGLEPRHCEDIKAVVAPGIGPKSFGTFEKQAPGCEPVTSHTVF